MTRRTILGVFAHPDDESMGPGATFAKYAAAGHRVAFVTVTDGGAGRHFEERPSDDAGRRALEEVRRGETIAAAKVLGAEPLRFLGWPDRGIGDRV
ncbi:MAG: PIG-L deacetylase family protein, partial [bacterium]